MELAISFPTIFLLFLKGNFRIFFLFSVKLKILIYKKIIQFSYQFFKEKIKKEKRKKWPCMEHAHPSYAHTIRQMFLTHGVKLKPKLYTQILHQCVISSLCAKQTLRLLRGKRPLFEEIVRKSFHTLELLEPRLGPCQPKMPGGIPPHS